MLSVFPRQLCPQTQVSNVTDIGEFVTQRMAFRCAYEGSRPVRLDVGYSLGQGLRICTEFELCAYLHTHASIDFRCLYGPTRDGVGTSDVPSGRPYNWTHGFQVWNCDRALLDARLQIRPHNGYSSCFQWLRDCPGRIQDNLEAAKMLSSRL